MTNMPVHKICEVCGKSFAVPPARALTAKACSNECAVKVRAESKKRQVTLACQKCGGAFTAPQCHVTRRKFCSHECKYSSEQFLKAMSDSMAGDKTPAWSGGVVKRDDGYIYEASRGHPLAAKGSSYVLQHRLIAERHLRAAMPDSVFLIEIDGEKYLRPDIDVHHKDRNRANNETQNLVVCTHGAHKLFHHGKQPAPSEYWQVSTS